MFQTQPLPLQMDSQGRLAPHETIDLHELLVAKTTGLVMLKKGISKVRDPELRQLCALAIAETEQNISEIIQLLQFRAILP